MFDLRRELPNQIFDGYTYGARATGIRIVPERARYSPSSCRLINPLSHFASKSKKKSNAEDRLIKIECRKDSLPCSASDLAAGVTNETSKSVKPSGCPPDAPARAAQDKMRRQ